MANVENQTYSGDAVQNSFRDKVIQKEEILDTDTTVDTEDTGNRLMSDEEWFAKYYKGQKDTELPKILVAESDPSRLAELKAKYGRKTEKTAGTFVDGKFDF